MDNDKDKEKLKCGECRFYREEWKECCYGGGFGWYPNPDDECELGFTKTWYNEKKRVLTMENLRKQWNDTCLAAGIDSMSVGKAAMTAAMLLVHGNHEAFTHNTKLVSDLQYIQQRYHIKGSEIADSSFVEELKACVEELEGYEKKNGFLAIPQEYKKWFKEMYSIEF